MPGADILACETLPCFAEIIALARLISQYLAAWAWFSFTLRDAEHLSDGTPLKQVMAALGEYPQMIAVGVNCIALEQTSAALQTLQQLMELPLVVYPNSGEQYDAVTRSWHTPDSGCHQLNDYLPDWLKAGAKLIGGCCRTSPEDIRCLAKSLSASQSSVQSNP